MDGLKRRPGIGLIGLGMKVVNTLRRSRPKLFHSEGGV